jgi:hypothetical protein
MSAFDPWRTFRIDVPLVKCARITRRVDGKGGLALPLGYLSLQAGIIPTLPHFQASAWLDPFEAFQTASMSAIRSCVSPPSGSVSSSSIV